MNTKNPFSQRTSRSSRSVSSRYGTNSTSNENNATNELSIQATVQDAPAAVKTRQRSQSPHARSSLLRRTFSRSRSRSQSRSRRMAYDDDDDDSSVASSASSCSSSSSSSAKGGKQMLVAVTSCRSDAYYSQKAPGAISMLPRKAPSALKTFHELAVGMKDAYEAVGATPLKMDKNSKEWTMLPRREQEGRQIMWEFLGNVNFLLALVDEVATDSATRGALKDDAQFKSVRDVIKRCNKVLERMLVRRENKYTLFFRLVQPHDAKDVEKMQRWNEKVEKAVATLAGTKSKQQKEQQPSTSDTASVVSNASATSTNSGKGIFRRGRGSSLGRRTRSRRATPTPSLRNKFRRESSESSANPGDDGFAVTNRNLAKLQKQNSRDMSPGPMMMQTNMQGATPTTSEVSQNKPKDDLVGLIRELHSDKDQNDNLMKKGQKEDLPAWTAKADIPSTVPKLPIEYIHRHRLMKQIVNSLVSRPAINRDQPQKEKKSLLVTSITSRHQDKAGNGKTTLAAAAIQSIEVRETFCDGIAWIQLGRAPLTEKDIRRLYEELYDQLIMRDATSFDKSDDNNINSMLLKSRRKFQGTDLEGMKEDLGRSLSNKNILICLDDVWNVEDAKRFIFENFEDNETNQSVESVNNTALHRVLVTTRIPGLMGEDNTNEIFVRIFSEQEAVKLLLSAAGRKLYGGKSSPIFDEARVIVKGCGNSPLALRLAGGMLRSSNRNWTLSSRTWTTLIDQCRLSLEEASRIRSFVNSVGRVVDLSFATVEDLCLRASLRRCFVTFAKVFHENDMLLTGRGIPRGIIRKLFTNVISGVEFESNTDVVSADIVIEMLEHMNLIQRAAHDADVNSNPARKDTVKDVTGKSEEKGNGDDTEPIEAEAAVVHHKLSYLMHESIKHIAAEMSSRPSSTFAPVADYFTAFKDELEVENERSEKAQSSSWFSSAAKYLFSSHTKEKNALSSDIQFHELLCHALLSEEKESEDSPFFDGDNVEKYIVAHLPNHLIRARMYQKASDMLLDKKFIQRRIKALGPLEATHHQVSDLVEFRKEYNRVHGKSENSANAGNSAEGTPKPKSLDAGKIVREGSRRIVTAIRAIESKDSDAGGSVDVAVCIATVGDHLLKARQTKESISRLEEATVLFRDIFGSYNEEVAKSLHASAKAYMKYGDEMTALAKLSEASSIYESCKFANKYDLIANTQLLANLLVSTGDWDRAMSKFEEIISKKSQLYGKASVPVAKAMNDYAITLAKHSRMSEALRQYEAARNVFNILSPSFNEPAENVGIYAFDITLIDLNIASIKSKLSDYEGALESYERGVKGLRLHIDREQAGTEHIDVARQAAQKRHLISAVSRIGSLRMKLKDNAGALEAYLMLIDEVDESSPEASQMEKAKAYVKCATIYRQIGSAENNANAILYLEKALKMYTALHGEEHKDTKAITSSLKQWQKGKA